MCLINRISIMVLSLWLSFILTPSVLASPKNLCINTAARDASYAKNVRIKIDEPYYYYRTERHNGEDFYVIGSHFVGFGTTTLNFKLTNVNKTNRAPNLRGKKEFDNIIKSFDRDGEITYVVGEWMSSNNPWGYPKSDNFETFMALLDPPKSLSLEEAAKQTWTAKQAARNGFTEIKKISIKHNKDGSVSFLRVFFSRPQSELAKRPRALIPTQREFNVVWEYNRGKSHALLVNEFIKKVNANPDKSLEEVFSQLTEMKLHSDLGYAVQKVKLIKNQQGQVLKVEASIIKVQ